jgi:predicted RNase H-like HicB family nuclease
MATVQYAVILERSATGYGAYAPDVLGCIAVAETEAEVTDLIREALEFHFESLREDGEPIPEPASRVIYVAVNRPDA